MTDIDRFWTTIDETPVRCVSLGDWIGAGGRGRGAELKMDFWAWIGPNLIRPAIRQTFLTGGHLLVLV